MLDLHNLIDQANELAPLSPTTVRLASWLSKPDYYLEDAAELICFDQALTLKLLRAANSAASGARSAIGSVPDAISRMGSAQVLALAVAASTKQYLTASIPSYGYNEGGLWRHSVATAIAAETLQISCKASAPPETFTAALLHDVGKLVMGRFLDPEILGYIQYAMESDNLSQVEAEYSLLEVHHGELGGLIAQHWNLPERIVKGITYHHNPDQVDDVICDFTYAANQLAKHIEAHLDGKKNELRITPGVARRLSLTPEFIRDLCPVAIARYEKLNCRYNSV